MAKEDVQGWIRTLWMPIMAVVAVGAMFLRGQSEQQHLGNSFRAHLSRSETFEGKLHECETAIMGIQNDLKWIKEGVDKNAGLQNEILRELRK